MSSTPPSTIDSPTLPRQVAVPWQKGFQLGHGVNAVTGQPSCNSPLAEFEMAQTGRKLSKSDFTLTVFSPGGNRSARAEYYTAISRAGSVIDFSEDIISRLSKLPRRQTLVLYHVSGEYEMQDLPSGVSLQKNLQEYWSEGDFRGAYGDYYISGSQSGFYLTALFLSQVPKRKLSKFNDLIAKSRRTSPFSTSSLEPTEKFTMTPVHWRAWGLPAGFAMEASTMFETFRLLAQVSKDAPGVPITARLSHYSTLMPPSLLSASAKMVPARVASGAYQFVPLAEGVYQLAPVFPITSPVQEAIGHMVSSDSASPRDPHDSPGPSALPPIAQPKFASVYDIFRDLERYRDHFTTLLGPNALHNHPTVIRRISAALEDLRSLSYDHRDMRVWNALRDHFEELYKVSSTLDTRYHFIQEMKYLDTNVIIDDGPGPAFRWSCGWLGPNSSDVAESGYSMATWSSELSPATRWRKLFNMLKQSFHPSMNFTSASLTVTGGSDGSRAPETRRSGSVCRIDESVLIIGWSLSCECTQEVKRRPTIRVLGGRRHSIFSGDLRIRLDSSIAAKWTCSVTYISRASYDFSELELGLPDHDDVNPLFCLPKS
ncbi:hypothetical protein V5O48_007935 [Marasmius crinis-equi]|uniref:Uncharacterized protein n=1 Tax=Marasmius crinis-equi TaxID=585013 RepID=A0ABR3FF88_9AGAR